MKLQNNSFKKERAFQCSTSCIAGKRFRAALAWGCYGCGLGRHNQAAAYFLQFQQGSHSWGLKIARAGVSRSATPALQQKKRGRGAPPAAAGFASNQTRCEGSGTISTAGGGRAGLGRSGLSQHQWWSSGARSAANGASTCRAQNGDTRRGWPAQPTERRPTAYAQS